MSMEKGIALITGAGGGIGLACARRLGASNRLVLLDRSPETVQQAQEICRQDGHDVVAAHALDLCSASEVANVMADPRFRDQISVLVNAAGLSPTMSDWRSIFDVNLVAGERMALATLANSRSGVVAIMIGSIAGVQASRTDADLNAVLADPLSSSFWDDIARHEEVLGRQWGAENFAYIFSKYAVSLQARRLAKEFAAKDGRIVSVAPGLIDTPMGRRETEPGTAGAMMKDFTPLKRLGLPDEIAAVVEFLSSPKASFVTGVELIVDGGLCASI